MPETTSYMHDFFLSVMTRHRFLFIALGICIAQFFLFTIPVHAGQLERFNTNDASIFYEQPLSGPAHELAGLLPPVRKELELALGFPVDFRPAIILVSNEDAFEQIVGNRLIVAYAVPDKMLMQGPAKTPSARGPYSSTSSAIFCSTDIYKRYPAGLTRGCPSG